MKTTAIIPARYASTRFPGKPLAILCGKPVIQHVYQRVSEVVTDVWVATDDPRIAGTVEQFGGKAVMTRADHKSGTDRVNEAAGLIGCDADIIVNIQGDEPFIRPSQIETVCSLFADPDTQIGTIAKPFSDMEMVNNPNCPKIVTDINGFALYFSRSIIPFVRGVDQARWLQVHPFLKHLGIYAYRKQVLQQLTLLPQSSLEIAESLEQLRWLQHGYKIKVGLTDVETIGIDTPQDLENAEKHISQML